MRDSVRASGGTPSRHLARRWSTPRRLALAVAALLTTILFAPQSASALSCAWTGTTSTDWVTASNWTACGSGVPGSADSVSIGTSSNNPQVSTGTQSASSVTLSGSATLSVSAGSLAVTNQITAPAGTSVALSGGSLSFGSLQVDNSSGLSVTGGSLSGTLNATATTTLSIAPADYGAGLTLGGTNLTVTQTDDVTMSSGTLAIGGDTFQLADKSLLSSGGGTITIGSGGKLQKLGGVDQSTVQPHIISSGLIEDSSASGGSLELNPTVAADQLGGSLKVDGTGIGQITLGNGNYQIGSGGLTVQSPGFVTTSGSAHVDLNGQTLTLSNSTYGLQMQSGASVTGSGTVAGVGALTLFGSSSLAPGTGNTMSISGEVDNFAGDLSGPGTVQVPGKWFCFGSLTDTGGATLDVTSGGLLRHVGGTAATVSPPVTDAGTVEQYSFASANLTISSLAVNPTGSVIAGAHQMDITTLSNLASGTLAGGAYSVAGGATLRFPGPITNLAANVTLTGTGALLKISDSTPALAGLSSISSGGLLTLNTTHSESTTLSSVDGGIALGGTSSLSTSGTTTIGSTGALSGTGTLGGDLVNGGTVSPGSGLTPGTLSIGGNYTQGAGGSLQAKVNGTGAGQFDVLSVAGNATLGGTLALAPSTAYAGSATTGDRIDLLTFTGTRTGNFATTTVTPPLAGGKGFAAVYDDLGKRVSAVVGLLPANTAPPVISGTAKQGQLLSATTGTWNNSPTSFTYAWRDCDKLGNNCSNIAGAGASKYRLAAGDVGHALRVVVMAANAYGSTAATSDHSATVSPLPAPQLSHVRLSPASFAAKKGSKLAFTLSEAATVTVVISQSRPGRKAHGHCKAHAKKGKRCAVKVKKLKRGFNGLAGANKFKLHLPGLKPGKYFATVTASSAAGQKSQPVVIRFTIK